MIKFVALMRRPAGMTHEQFFEYHRNLHAKKYMADPTVRRLCRKYVQSHAVEGKLHGFPSRLSMASPKSGSTPPKTSTKPSRRPLTTPTSGRTNRTS